MNRFLSISTVAILLAALLSLLFGAAIDYAEAQPAPPSRSVPPLPTKARNGKSEQARVLREAAAIIEAEERRQLEVRQAGIEADVRAGLAGRTNETIKNVSFMDMEHGLEMRVTFEPRDR